MERGRGGTSSFFCVRPYSGLSQGRNVAAANEGAAVCRKESRDVRRTSSLCREKTEGWTRPLKRRGHTRLSAQQAAVSRSVPSREIYAVRPHAPQEVQTETQMSRSHARTRIYLHSLARRYFWGAEAEPVGVTMNVPENRPGALNSAPEVLETSRRALVPLTLDLTLCQVPICCQSHVYKQMIVSGAPCVCSQRQELKEGELKCLCIHKAKIIIKNPQLRESCVIVKDRNSE